MKLLLLTLLICFNGFGQEILYPRQDHAKHFLLGMGVGAGIYFTTYEITENKRKALAFGILGGLVAGCVKESLDVLAFKGDFEIADVAWTTLGSVSVVIPLDIFMYNNGNKILTAYPKPPVRPTWRDRRTMRLNEKARVRELEDSINDNKNKFWH